MERELKLGRVYKSYTGAYVVPISYAKELVTFKRIPDGTIFNTTISDFLAPLDDNITSLTHEYRYELADVIHTINGSDQKIQEIKKHDGFCPCNTDCTNSTKCMCREFREQMFDGPCKYGVYKKTWIG